MSVHAEIPLILLVAGALVATVGGLASGALYDQANDAVVAQIGSAKVHASTVRKALVGMPAFELDALGSTKFEILKRYVDEAIVNEELLAEAARRKGAQEDRAVQIPLKKVLASALVRRELLDLGRREDLPMDEVKKYYDGHVAEYRTPERVRVFHIVLPLEQKVRAEETLLKVKADPTREGWSKIAADTSEDPNTKRSGGDLGFVSADGRTSEPNVVVRKEVVDAAFKLKDGDIAPNLVQSEVGHHIVWRRGSVPAMVRSLADETATIREILFEQKRKAGYRALVERIRVRAQEEVDDELLPLVSVDVGPRPTPRPKK